MSNIMQFVPRDNSESQDGECSDRVAVTNLASVPQTSSGYYDADKCRAYIANQIKVSKIDRFAAQICKALEVEQSLHTRLGNILNMFVKKSAQVTQDFTFRCKLGLQRHRHDRILNQQRKPHKNTKDPRYSDLKHHSISNDLLYGPGAQLVHALLTQSTPYTKHVKRKHDPHRYVMSDQLDNEVIKNASNIASLTEDDYFLSESFEPTLFVKKLGDCIRLNLRKSTAISIQLGAMRQTFEKLASEHRNKVDQVYAAEEERQATTVVLRSAHSLSVAAIKATSTPVHVHSNNEI